MHKQTNKPNTFLKRVLLLLEYTLQNKISVRITCNLITGGPYLNFTSKIKFQEKRNFQVENLFIQLQV